ncbi:MAG: phosphoribosylanthranilate isomerase [Pseudomonadota bacterium]
MARTRIKICCIETEGEARMAVAAGADLLGLVGPMPSGPGPIPLPHAAEIAGAAPPWARPVLLTASETAYAIEADATLAGVGTVQVVRHIAPGEAAKLATRGLTVIQVIHMSDPGALNVMERHAPHCDAFLLDSGRPGEAVLGGTGETHDWALSAEVVHRSPRPVFLAGGLDPSNVAEAIARVRPFGVDVCSRLRPEGRLDRAQLEAFVSAVCRTESQAA